MASYKEQYYTLSEEEIQSLIAKAKSGNSSAQYELLKVFNNFLTKYVTLLYHGKYNLSDYDIRRFTSLFVKDNFVRFNLMKNQLNQGGYKHVNECLRRHNVYGKKVWRRRGCKADCQYDLFSMHNKIPEERLRKRADSF